jgi:protein SCO1/2
MKRSILTISFCFILFPIFSQTGNDDEIEIGVVEKLNQYVPLDTYLVNEEGDTVLLRNLYDKPTILNFVYYRCPGICSPLMNGLAEAIDKTDLILGEDYQVLTISFDPRESTLLAERKKNNYLNMAERKEEVENGWLFFTADSASIKALTDATGFRYKPTGNDFIHSATIIFTDPEGKITRYMNGIYFLPFEIKMSVIEASQGKSGPTINKVLQYCYSYDPDGQKYVMNITKVAGTLIIFIALILLIVLLFVRRKKINA